MPWFVYILECRDRSLYVGVTNDVEKRLAAHASGKGARYTRGRGPLTVRHVEEAATRAEAQSREAAIKRLTRAQKLALFSPRTSSRPSPRDRSSSSGPSRARGRGPT